MNDRVSGEKFHRHNNNFKLQNFKISAVCTLYNVFLKHVKSKLKPFSFFFFAMKISDMAAHRNNICGFGVVCLFVCLSIEYIYFTWMARKLEVSILCLWVPAFEISLGVSIFEPYRSVVLVHCCMFAGFTICPKGLLPRVGSLFRLISL